MKTKKRFLSILLSLVLVIGLIMGMSVTAFAEDGTADTESVPAYTVEFTFDGKQYVMPGDSTVALKEILDCIGLTGEVADVKVSDSTLFSGSNDSGEWVVTAHRAFSTDEWMRVIIDSRVYEIVVTDTKYTTSQTVTTDGNDWDWFGEGKYFVCDNSQTYTINGSIVALAPSDGSGTDHGSNDWTATIDASGKLTHKIGSAQYTATLSGNNNTWHLYWNGYAPGYYGSGAAMWEQTYTAPPTVDPTVTAPTLAVGRDYNGEALQLITAEATSNSSGTRYYGLGTSSSSVPSTWYTSITDSNLKKTDQGTYYVWYKQDAVTGYNAKTATYAGSVTINRKEVGLTWGDSTSFTYDGQLHAPTVTATGLISGDTCDVTVTGDQINYSASAYTATASNLSNDNYKLPDSGTTQTFTIGQREVTLSWPANTTYPYNGKEQTPVATAGNLVSGDTCIVTVTGGETNVGSNYTATASGLSNDNYKLPGSNKTCTFSISQAELTVTANNHTITYGDAPANSGVGYSGFQNGETAAVLGGTLTYSYNYEQYGNVGNSYTITPGGLTSSNYDIQYVAGTLMVNPKSVTPSLTGAVSKVYDGGTSVTGATSTLGITLSGVVNSDDVSATIGSAAYGSANVGTDISVTASNITLTGEKAENYALSATTASVNVGEITTRAITVKATDQSVKLNGSITTYASDSAMATVTEGTLVSGHTLDSITLTQSSTANVTTEGTITPSTATIKNGNEDTTANYSITYTNGTLTVTQGSPAVKGALGAANITYGQMLADSAISGSMKDPISDADVPGTFSWDEPTTKPAVADSNTTEYAWTFTPTDSTNYANATGTLKVTVSQKTASLAWEGTALTYNGEAQKPTASVSNLEEGDSCTVTVTGEQTVYSATAYTATASSLSNSNYALPASDNAQQAFTIGQRPITITATNQSVALNGNITDYATDNAMVSIGGSGLVTGENGNHTLDSVTLTPSSTANVTTSGTITPSAAVIMNGSTDVTANYAIGYNDGTLTVTQGAPAVNEAVSAADITYGQTLADSAISGSMKDPISDADVAGTFTWDEPTTKPAVADSNTTEYAWTFTPTDSINYANATGALKVTVSQKTAALAWEGTAMTYNGAAQKPTASVSNLEEGDDCTVTVDGAQTEYSATAYTATAIALSNSNYTLPPSDDAKHAFTIGQRPVTITATNQDVALNGNITDYATDNTMVSISGDGLATGDTVNHVLVSLTLTPDIETKVTGTGKITPSGAVIKSGEDEVTGNYNITYTDGVLTVGKAGLTVATAPSATGITYGQTLADSRITGAMKYVNTFDNTETDIPGTFTWDDTSIMPAAADSDKTEYAYTFTPTDSASYANYKGKLTLTVGKSDATVKKAPVARTLTYNSQAQELITAGEADGGTMKYAVTTENQEPAADSYTFDNTSIPTATDAGTYYVWYKAAGDANHNDSEPGHVTAVIKAPISATVTFKVANGSWDEGEGEAATADKTVTLTGWEGDTLKLAASDIPSAGTKPGDGYKEGGWEIAPVAGTVVTKDTTYTYKYAAKDSVVRKVTFKVVNGAWDDGNAANVIVTLEGVEGDTLILKAEQFPAVGNKPAEGFAAGNWNPEKKDETVVDEDVTYTYIYEPLDTTDGEAEFAGDNTDSGAKGIDTDKVSGQMNEIAKTDKTAVAAGQSKEVTVKLEAKSVEEGSVPETEKTSVAAAVNDLVPEGDKGTVVSDFLDISVDKIVVVYDVDETTGTKKENNTVRTQLINLDRVVDIPVKYDLTGKYNPVVIRIHDGKTQVFTRLDAAPAATEMKDGTFYVEGSGKDAIIHIYSDKFSTYAIVTHGSEEKKDEPVNDKPEEDKPDDKKDDAITFVARLYRLVLDRVEEDLGYDAWVNAMAVDKAGAAQVINGFFMSDEYLGQKHSSEDTVRRLYRVMLDREPDEEGLKNWARILDEGAPIMQVIRDIGQTDEKFFALCKDYNVDPGIIRSGTVKPGGNTTKTRAFAARCYQALLGRPADEDGLEGWTQALLTGKTNAKQMVLAFVNSDEFKARNLTNGQIVEALYAAMLGRAADAEGLQNWTAVLDNGSSVAAVIEAICGTEEFQTVCRGCGISTGNQDDAADQDQKKEEAITYVARLYRLVLDRVEENLGYDAWVNALAAGKAGAARVIDGFFRSDEYLAQNHPSEETVRRLYRVMLDREADEEGLKNWAAILDGGTTVMQVIRGIGQTDSKYFEVCQAYNVDPGIVRRGNVTPMTPVSEFTNETWIRAFVEHCYEAVLGRAGDAEGVANYTQAILAGTKTPKSVAREFVFSAEFRNNLPGNEAFIRILYQVYCYREPGAEEVAPWAEMLGKGATLDEIVNAFAASEEFKAIVNGMKE